MESYSITNENGFVPQNEKFENGGTMRDADKRMYYIVAPHSFAYNPARINVGSIGYQNLDKNVIVSSLYEVFQTTDKIDDRFLWHWFKSPDFQKLIEQLQEGGVRLYFYYDKLCMGTFSFPKIEEQHQIGEYLDQLDHLITLHQRTCNFFLLEHCAYCKINFMLAWEQRKLDEVFTSLQNNTLSRAELSSEQGGALNVHYGDVLIKFGEYLDLKKEVLPMISDSSIIGKYKASFLQNGDVIVADTAEDETVGKCSEIAGLTDEIALSGLHTIPYRPMFKFASGFLGYYMNSNSYHSQLLPLMQGIKVTSISKSAMRNTDICYPKTEDEQAEISTFFRTLDYLITLHQRE